MKKVQKKQFIWSNKYNLLTDSQKTFVKKELKKESKIKGEQYAKMKLKTYLSRLEDD